MPDGGWNARSFARFGATLVTDMVRVARYSRKRQEKAVREQVLGFMRSQVDRVTAAPFEQKSGKAGPTDNHGGQTLPFSVTLDLPASEAFWTAILNDIFREREDIAIEVMMKPALQSLISQGAQKTSVLLGTTLPPHVQQISLPTIANQMANQVKAINATTRQQLQRIISDAVAKGSTVRATIDQIKADIPSLEARAATIARTELSMAYTRGSIETFMASPSVTHVSVVGCLHRNDSNNYWQGQHTCNIKMIPKQFASQLTFHPNHTGVMVPAAFTS